MQYYKHRFIAVNKKREINRIFVFPKKNSGFEFYFKPLFGAKNQFTKYIKVQLPYRKVL